MLVHALRLRHKGQRIPADELRATPPLAGRLRYEDSFYGGRDGRGPKVCLLMPLDPDITDPLVQLFSTGIKIEPRGILIRGIEDEWRRKTRIEHPQSLWCWPTAQPGPDMTRVWVPPHPNELARLVRDPV